MFFILLVNCFSQQNISYYLFLNLYFQANLVAKARLSCNQRNSCLANSTFEYAKFKK